MRYEMEGVAPPPPQLTGILFLLQKQFIFYQEEPIFLHKKGKQAILVTLFTASQCL